MTVPEPWEFDAMTWDELNALRDQVAHYIDKVNTAQWVARERERSRVPEDDDTIYHHDGVIL